MQAGRAVVKQYLDLGVADAEAVRVADGGGEQAKPLVHRQGRVNARFADVGERAVRIVFRNEYSSFNLARCMDKALYSISNCIIYIRAS